MAYSSSASAIVLAGGRSRRLGQDKRRLRVFGPDQPTLLERTVNTATQLCADVVVVLNDPESWPHLPGRLVPDLYADGGPLGGIYSGLQAAQFETALVLACDMPFLNPALLQAMLARPGEYDVLMPRSLGTQRTRNAHAVEPLHAVYRRSCLAPIQQLLEQGERQVTALLDVVRVAFMEPDEIRCYDPEGRSFVNINTLEQLREAGLG